MRNRALLALIVSGLFAAPALAVVVPINLEWRPLNQTAVVNDVVGIGLYAVCDPNQTQLFRAADVVFTWDPGHLQFLGINNTGAVALLASNLPANDAYGLNGATPPPTDGDGYYLAWANLGDPLIVTDAGALLTTFQFRALAQTPATLLSLAVSGGNPALATRVLGSTEGGTIVTGTLGMPASVEILPEPASLVLAGMVLVLLRRR